jgi:large subunit ribosomal protein L15
MMRLHNLRPRPGARHRVKRLGCGESSGHGKTSGKGHKGQKARSGGSIRLGFEGGQMPLIRRLPKRGFNNAAFHKRYAIVNLDDLGRFKVGSTVNEQALRQSKLVRGNFDGIKILGDGELKHGLKVEADKVSASAREKIEKAGGTVTLRETRTRGEISTKEGVDLVDAGVSPEGAEGSQPTRLSPHETRPPAGSTTKRPAKAKAEPKKKTSRKK